MRDVIFFCLLLLLAGDAVGQKPPVIYKIPADSVLMSYCDSTELILENHTQNVPGFLFNNGNGRTIFKRGAQKLNDSMYLVGADTINLGARNWKQGGNKFGAIGVLGTMDNNHLDLYTNAIRRARLDSIGQFSIDYHSGWSYANAFALTNTNGTYPWVNLATTSGSVTLDLRPNNFAYPTPTFEIHTGDSTVIQSLYYNTMLVKAPYGLDLMGGGGGGAIRSPLTPCASFDFNGNFMLGPPATDNGYRLQVTGKSTFSDTVAVSGHFRALSSVRFAALSSDTTKTRVLVADASGNISYRDASTLAANDWLRSSLAVNGTIKAKKLILGAKDWPDYVFDSSYLPMPLTQLKEYIRLNKHLPGIVPAAAAEKSGVDVGETQASLLKKIEELTLYSIKQDEEIDHLKAEMAELRKLIMEKATSNPK